MTHGLTDFVSCGSPGTAASAEAICRWMTSSPRSATRPSIAGTKGSILADIPSSGFGPLPAPQTVIRSSVTVVRGHETRTIHGKVRADRIYTTADGKRAIASPGPEAMATEGFDSPWQFWDEAIVKAMQAALEAGWRREHAPTARQPPSTCTAYRDTGRQYPGWSLNAMKEDFERAVEWLKGRRYDLGPDDLVYRSLSQARVQDAIARATRSWASYLAHTRPVELSSLPPVIPCAATAARSPAGWCGSLRCTKSRKPVTGGSGPRAADPRSSSSISVPQLSGSFSTPCCASRS